MPRPSSTHASVFLLAACLAFSLPTLRAGSSRDNGKGALKSGKSTPFTAKETTTVTPPPPPGAKNNPYRASEYAGRVLKGPWPEAEGVIATRPVSALHYARCVLKRRWPEGEAAIRRDARCALIYAAEVLRERWPEAEPVILEHNETATWYAALVINGRWPEYEERMAKTRWYAPYVVRVLRQRVPEAESTLVTQYWYEGGYLQSLVGTPDESVEKTLLNLVSKQPPKQRGTIHPIMTYIEYARRSPWTEAEPFILEDEDLTDRYLGFAFLRKRWPEYEKRIRARFGDPLKQEPVLKSLFLYAGGLDSGVRLPADLEVMLHENVLKDSLLLGRYAWPGIYGAGESHPKFENSLLSTLIRFPKTRWGKYADEFRRLAELGVYYACSIRGARWPELEKFLYDEPLTALDYRRHFAELRVWPDFEAALIATKHVYCLQRYRDTTAPEKFKVVPCFERDDKKLSLAEASVLLEDPSRAFRYARDVIQGRWPELEKRLASGSFHGGGFTGGTEYGAAFSDIYTNEFGRSMRGCAGESERIATRYVREIVRGPMPEYEAKFAEGTESSIHYAWAIGCDFPAGEPRIWESVAHGTNGWNNMHRYIMGLLDSSEATLDFTRLFKGRDGARMCREALREFLIYSSGRNEPSEDLLRAALNSRE